MYYTVRVILQYSNQCGFAVRYTVRYGIQVRYGMVYGTAVRYGTLYSTIRYGLRFCCMVHGTVWCTVHGKV